MPGQLNPPAAALLSILGLKSQGRTPSDFGGIVMPTMEMTDFYLRSQCQQVVITDTVPINLSGFQQFFTTPPAFTVPANYWRYVESFQIDIGGFAVGTTVSAAAAYMSGFGLSGCWSAGDWMSTTAAVALGHCTPPALRRVWLPPNSVMGFTCGVNTPAVASTIKAYLVYQDFLG